MSDQEKRDAVVSMRGNPILRHGEPAPFLARPNVARKRFGLF
jgi:hypothetical protein